MDIQEKRRDIRSDIFIQTTISDPTTIGNKEAEVGGWIKNVSKEGIGLEVCVSSSDEVKYLLELTEKKQDVLATIALPNDYYLKTNCRVVWGKLLHKKTLHIYSMGLQVLKTDDPLQYYKWNSFVETFLR